MGCSEYQNPDDFESQVLSMALSMESLTLEEVEIILTELYKDMLSELNRALDKLRMSEATSGRYRIATVERAEDVPLGNYIGDTKITLEAINGKVETHDQAFPEHPSLRDTDTEKHHGHTVTQRNEEGMFSTIEFLRTPDTPEGPGKTVISGGKIVEDDEDM